MQQQEAVNFVEDVLKLSSPMSKLKENKALILNEIIKAFLSVPFQNIHLLCETKAGRHVYTYLGRVQRQCDERVWRSLLLTLPLHEISSGSIRL